MVVNLIAPIAMDEGLRFAIREGGRTVGAGVVASIMEQEADADACLPGRPVATPCSPRRSAGQKGLDPAGHPG
jgi:hypothetical protein